MRLARFLELHQVLCVEVETQRRNFCFDVEPTMSREVIVP